MNRGTYLVLLVSAILVIDQASKFWVKTHMQIGDEFPILGLSWARIHFVENEGMAFGWQIPAAYGKLILSLFRVGAIAFLIYLIRQMLQAGAGMSLITCFGLILAGAVGNVIDSAFYGLVFSASPFHGGLAEFLPEAGGYAGFLHGKVVDMLYFPMVQTNWPSWVPFVGGDSFLFFRPVFNIADSAITVGVAILLLFHRSFFSQDREENIEATSAEQKTEG